MSTTTVFSFGDRIRHVRRPEWGVGSVVKVENVTSDGQTAQRLSIRFPNEGMKTLLTSHAELERVAAESAANGLAHENGEAPAMNVWHAVDQKGWLEPLARKKIEDTMIALPMEARDAFNSLKRRLQFTLDLYRFDRHGSRLLDWAVAQSQLEDPLSRFTRHDLERLFDRWAIDRETHLLRLLQEARTEPGLVQQLSGTAPQAAKDAVRRLNARVFT